MIRVNAQLLRAVALHQSTQETRYYLRGVQIEPHAAGGAIMVATNGHTLAAAIDEAAEYEITADNGAGLIFPVDKSLWSKLAAKSGESRRVAELHAGMIAVYAETDHQGIEPSRELILSQPAAPIDGTFPDWRRVIPQSDDLAPGGLTSFDADYLRRFADTARALGATDVAVIGNKAKAPSLIEFGGQHHGKAFGLLMPRQFDAAGAAPTWATKPLQPADTAAA